MRFGIKVLFWNIVLVLLAFGISGYLFVVYNFRSALNLEIESASEENQMLHTIIESETARLILLKEYESIQSLANTGRNLAERFSNSRSVFSLIDQEHQIVYSGGAGSEEMELVKRLTAGLESGKKNYLIIEAEHQHYLYTASRLNSINDESLFIINQKDIERVYLDMEQQLQNYQIIMAIAIGFCILGMSIISYLLTRSIHKLNETTGIIATGDYAVRTNIASSDEIGDLGKKFNIMADAVEKHVAELILESQRWESFVSNFTHELKTPLTAVIGYADMIRSKNMTDEKRVMAADYIFQESMRLETMSMKLFDLILSDKTELKKSRVNAARMLMEAEQSVKPVLQQEGKQIVMDICPGAFNGDADLMKTVIINLIDNARKATVQGDTIVVYSYWEGNNYVIEVIDQGTGIAAEEIDRITEAFYMVDKSRSRRSGGAGLGLTLAVKIVGLHQGEILPASTLGEGTTMKVVLRGAGDEEE